MTAIDRRDIIPGRILKVIRRNIKTARDRRQVTITIVLAEEHGGVAKFARIGVGTPEWVARHGDLLNTEEMHFYFPAEFWQNFARDYLGQTPHKI